MRALNTVQQQAVEADFKPILVVAGAGTGKTTVLMRRVVHMIESGFDVNKILIITFTNKSRDEIKSRIFKETKKNPKNVYTFHGLFHYILKVRGITYLQKPREFKIIDESDQRSIIRKIIKDLNLVNFFDNKNIRQIMVEIGWHKIMESLTSIYIKDKSLRISRHNSEDFKEIYAKYQEYLSKAGLLDFCDLEVLANEALKIDSLREYWSKYFEAILIDEFQDTSELQFEVVKKLVNENQNIFCVGDPDQSIYGFRGAKPEICNDFVDFFENSQIIKLEENYRSTKNILGVANHLINKNESIFSKVLFTNNEIGEKVRCKSFNSEFDEVEWVLNQIDFLRKKDSLSLSDFVILYRNNRFAKPFEVELHKRKWAFNITNSVEFFNREEVRVMKSFLQMIFFPKTSFLDLVSIKERFPGILPKVGYKTLDEFNVFSLEYERDVFLSCQNIGKCKAMKPKDKEAFSNLAVMLQKFREAKDMRINDLISFIFKHSGYRDYLQSKQELETRSENVEKFGEILVNFEGGRASNEEIVSEIAHFGLNLSSSSSEALLLSTVHQAKGLEFKYVFLVKMSDGAFPSDISLWEGQQSVTEERRLAYVAFTRAKKQLFITWSPLMDRMSKSSFDVASRFVEEVKDLEEVDFDAGKPIYRKNPFRGLWS